MRPTTADGWFLAALVAIGVVASIPFIPLVIIALVILILRAPAAAVGTTNRTRQVLGDVSPGELFGISSRILFPMVAAGWFLIALLSGGLIGAQVPWLGWIVGVILLVAPTLIVYRAMHPEIASVPFVEWIGSQRPGPVAAPIALWIACAWLVWSITTWTTFLGSTWTTICTFVFVLAVIVLPLLLILIEPREGRRLYGFVGVTIAIGLLTLLAYQAGLTPEPRAWQ